MMTRRPRSILVALAFLAFVSLGLPDTLHGVAWPSVRATFGLPVSQLGLLLLSGMCGYLSASFFGGAVAALLGVGRVLAISGGLVTLSLAGYALAPAWQVMVGFGVLAGLGAGAIDAGLNAYIAHEFSPRIVNWLHACWGIGATIGPLIMTLAIDRGAGWRWGYGSVGCIIALMTLGFVLTVHWWESPAGAPAPPESAGPVRGLKVTAKGTGVTVLGALGRGEVLLNILLFFIYTGLEATVGSWTYSLLTESRGVSHALAGTCVSIYWGSLTLGRIAFGQASVHVPAAIILHLSLLTAPVAAALIWWSPFGRGDVIGLAIMGLALAPIFPLLMSETPSRLAAGVATHAIGFQVSAACLGAAVMPAIGGLMSRGLGIEVIGAFLVAQAIALLVLRFIVLRWTPASNSEPPVDDLAVARETRSRSTHVNPVQE